MNAPSVLGSIALIVSTGLVLSVAVAIGTALVWPVIERWTADASLRWRLRIDTAIAIAPVAIPAIILALCLAPGLVGHWTGHEDHCASHVGHPHLCLVHASIPLTPPLALGLVVFGLGVLLALRQGARWLRDLRREQRALNETSIHACAPDVQVVRSSDFFALTGGLFRSQIWISSALDLALTRRERDVVLAHERAHAARRDPLRSLLIRILSGLHLPGTRRAILSTLRLACEEECDARAARFVGDRLRVAETLVRVEGLMQRPGSTPPFATVSSAVAGSHVADRVHRLLGQEPPDPSELYTSPLLVAAGAGCLLAVKPLHHLVEHALAALFQVL